MQAADLLSFSRSLEHACVERKDVRATNLPSLGESLIAADALSWRSSSTPESLANWSLWFSLVRKCIIDCSALQTRRMPPAPAPSTPAAACSTCLVGGTLSRKQLRARHNWMIVGHSEHAAWLLAWLLAGDYPYIVGARSCFLARCQIMFMPINASSFISCHYCQTHAPTGQMCSTTITLTTQACLLGVAISRGCLSMKSQRTFLYGFSDKSNAYREHCWWSECLPIPSWYKTGLNLFFVRNWNNLRAGVDYQSPSMSVSTQIFPCTRTSPHVLHWLTDKLSPNTQLPRLHLLFVELNLKGNFDSTKTCCSSLTWARHVISNVLLINRLINKFCSTPVL